MPAMRKDEAQWDLKSPRHDLLSYLAGADLLRMSRLQGQRLLVMQVGKLATGWQSDGRANGAFWRLVASIPRMAWTGGLF